MKTLITFFILFQSLSLLAQDSLSIKEGVFSMSEGNQPGYSVVVPGARLKDIISDWNKYLRQKTKSKFKKINGEYVISSAIISELTTDTVGMFTKIEELSAGVQLTSFISKGNSLFISTTSDAEVGRKIKFFIRNFAVNAYRNTITDELSSEQKNLKSIESEIKNLESNNDYLEKKTKSKNRSIDRLNDDIKSNLNFQDFKSKAILQEQQTLATFIDPSELKTAQQKKLKTLEKEKAKLKKQNEGLNKKVDQLESEIKSMGNNIDKNNSDKIPEKKTELEKQKVVVSNLEEKLKRVK